jgi:hypothetical protein
MPVITISSIFLPGIAIILPMRINGSIFGSSTVALVYQRQKLSHLSNYLRRKKSHDSIRNIAREAKSSKEAGQ